MSYASEVMGDRARLELLHSVGSELAKPGDACERLSHALSLVSCEFCREVVLEFEPPDGERRTVRSGKDAVPTVLEALALPVVVRRRAWGTLTLHASSFAPTDRVLGELLADRIATHLHAEYGEPPAANELDALLLGIVGHDLRNPLGIVTLAASSLLASELNEAQRRTVGRLITASQQSTRLVADLLDFTIARRGGIPLVRTHCDLHDVVAQALEDLRSIWPGRELIHARIGRARCSFDQDRILQVVMNLVGNALQHSPAGTAVRIETRGESGAVVFTVTNQGRPIPASLRPQLFAPLRRGDGAGRRRGSVGLGLFIVQHLVLAHGGTIDVVSNESDGTCFSFRLPDAPASPPL